MAGASASVDTLLADAISKMDAMTKRMDALETGEGKKDPIKGDNDDKKKDDAAKSAKGDDDSDRKSDATTPRVVLDDEERDKEKDDAAEVPTSALGKGDKKKADDGELGDRSTAKLIRKPIKADKAAKGDATQRVGQGRR